MYLHIRFNLYATLAAGMSKPDQWKKLTIIFVRHAQSSNNTIYDQVRSKYANDLLGSSHDNTVSNEIMEEEETKLRDADCGLSEKGLEQCSCLTNFFNSGGLTRIMNDNANSYDKWEIISSPMKRCLLTSEAISKGMGNKTVKVIPNLYELFGCYDTDHSTGLTIGVRGMTSDNIQNQFLNFVCEKGMENGWYDLPAKDQFLNFVCEKGMENGWYDLPAKETHTQFNDRVTKIVASLWNRVEATDCIQSPKAMNGLGLMIVSHSMLISAVISELIGAKQMLCLQQNTAYCVMELYSTDDWIDGEGVRRTKRLGAIKCINGFDHLSQHQQLWTGDSAFDDHWIQELEW